MTRRIAVVLKGYPRLSETFIAQELLGLQRRGLAFRIVSLRRPLPGRTNIVITRDAGFRAEGAVVTTSFDAAHAVAMGDALRVEDANGELLTGNVGDAAALSAGSPLRRTTRTATIAAARAERKHGSARAARFGGRSTLA